MLGSQAEPHGLTRWMQDSPAGHCAAVTQALFVVTLQPPVASSEIWQNAQSAFDVHPRSVKTLHVPGAFIKPLGSCHSLIPPGAKSMAISPNGSDTGSGSTHSSAAMYRFVAFCVIATVPRSLTAPSVRLSQNATSVFDPRLTQACPAGQSEFTTQARVVVTEQFPQLSATARSSTRPPPGAVFEVAPTHQSASDASTFGV
jgi:hypothetical protein